MSLLSACLNVRPAMYDSVRRALRSIGSAVLAAAAVLVLQEVAAPVPVHAEQAAAAESFVNSVGVNLHLSYRDTLYYQNFDLIYASLHSLGIRHVRDGLPLSPPPNFYARLKQLSQEGIHVDLITSPGETLTDLQRVQKAAYPALENLEAPNEYDAKGADWLPVLKAYLPKLAADVAALPGKPAWERVIGPSLTQQKSYALLGDVDAWASYGNLHNYLSGFNPGTNGWGDNGYGSIAWNLGNVGVTNPGQPVMTTETGYTNQKGAPGYVPQSISARYLPRLLLEQWNHGIYRTYLYELLSSGGQDFGLLSSAGVQKPAFSAIANLLAMLSDPGSAIAPGSLSYSMNGARPDVQRALFQKRDGSFYLALWVEAPGWNVNTKSFIPVPAQSATLVFGQPIGQITAFTFNDNGGVTRSTLTTGRKVEISITDKLTLFHIVPQRRTMGHAVSQASRSVICATGDCSHPRQDMKLASR